MSAVDDAKARLSGGYYNNGVISPSNPGGFGNFGHVTNMFAAATDIEMVGDAATDEANRATTQANAAAASAASAFNAPGTKATSADNRTLPLTSALPVSMTFTLAEAGKAFALGQTVGFAMTASPLNQVAGVITAFDPTTKVMTFTAQFVAGAGSSSAWTVALSAPVDGTLTGRVTALELANSKQKARARLLYKEFI